MTRFTLAPGYLKFTYSGVAQPHHCIIPVHFAGEPVPGTIPNVLNRPGDSIPADVALNTLLSFVIHFYHTSVTFGQAEAHTVSTDDPPVDGFIAAWDAALVGVSTVAQVPWSRATWSFKTRFGHPLKVVLMESSYAVNQIYRPPFAPGIEADFYDYMTSDNCVWRGRDGATAYSLSSIITKTDDVLRRRAGY